MKSWFPTLGQRLLSLLLLTILGGILSATLVRFSPGYGMDVRELDPRLSESSVEAIRSEHHQDANLIRYYVKYFAAAAHGDFGVSESLDRPIAELVTERLPATARSVLLGVASAWSLALVLSGLGLVAKGWFPEVSSAVLIGFLLSLPSAVVALAFLYLRGPVFLALAVVIFPKIFRFTRNLFLHADDQPHVLAARARGIGSCRVFLHHVIPSAAPALMALLGISLSMAFGAAIPIEALCDSPGIGQLAWYAAINRDLPLVMNLTLIVTLVTVASNSLAGFSSRLVVRQP
ncbi:MAG TPA: ABC transporter permease [Terriglobales bacterium]|nr:ABC transporter permease [Terriglobales bacterium]